MNICSECFQLTHLCKCDTQTNTALVEEEFDKMVASASIPNLASLFKQGIADGTISAQAAGSVFVA